MMKQNSILLPESIRSLIGQRQGLTDRIGCSSSTVILYDDMVLKIEPPSPENETAAVMMRYLASKLPVPALLADVTDSGLRYLLMYRVPGVMSCAAEWLDRPNALIDRLAEGLHMLWAVDVTDCPRRFDLDHELAAARRRAESGLVDLSARIPAHDMLLPDALRDPLRLIQYLEENRPTEELVLSHGDFCLPNLLLDGERIGGFIDLGACGTADRWRDITMCLVSLRRNLNGFFGGPVRPAPDEKYFFAALGIPLDRERLRYYQLLDLFF